MSGAGSTFDGGGVQAVDIQLVADFFQQAQFGFLQGAIGGGHVAGQRIGGFKQSFGQVITDKSEQRIQTVLDAEQIKHGLRHDVCHFINENLLDIDGIERTETTLTFKEF